MFVSVGHTDLMTVCEEDTIYDIQAKYRDLYNHHAGSYIWRKWTKNVSYAVYML